jgi:Fe-S oxidoreductase
MEPPKRLAREVTAVPAVVSEAVYETVYRLADECRQCYQCGQCRGACPSGFDLDGGPRRIVRLILDGDVDRLLTDEDVWRCSECGSCTDVCPMEVDVAAMLAAVRQLQRDHGGVRCPERAAADVAGKRLDGNDKIDNMQFGVAMATKGFVPKDKMGAAEAGLKIARQMLKRSGPAAGGAPSPDAKPFYAGCSLPQDHEAYEATHKVARDLGVELAEASEAGCCGHPSRGQTGARYASEELVLTACPACDQGLREAELQTRPLWNALTEHADRNGRTLEAANDRFVPYVGCLSERGPALSSLSAAAALAGVQIEMSYPSLHAGCCGALGGMYRGETDAAKKLLAFAKGKGAPIVTPCLLCRDNLRSAARKEGTAIDVYFWPEFFQAAPAAAGADTPREAS